MCRDFARIIFSVLNPDLVCTCLDFSLAGGGNWTTFCVTVVHGLTAQIFFWYQQKALPHLFVLVNCATSEVEKCLPLLIQCNCRPPNHARNLFIFLRGLLKKLTFWSEKVVMQGELWSLLCSFVADTVPESLEARLSFLSFGGQWLFSPPPCFFFFVFRMIYVVI